MPGPPFLDEEEEEPRPELSCALRSTELNPSRGRTLAAPHGVLAWGASLVATMIVAVELLLIPPLRLVLVVKRDRARACRWSSWGRPVLGTSKSDVSCIEVNEGRPSVLLRRPRSRIFFVVVAGRARAVAQSVARSGPAP